MLRCSERLRLSQAFAFVFWGFLSLKATGVGRRPGSFHLRIQYLPNYVGCHASILSQSASKTRLNTFHSLTPERRSQALRSSSLHDGTGAVRSRFPFPIKLTMTQRRSLDCNWSRFKPTISERRSPHPNSNPSISPSTRSPTGFQFYSDSLPGMRSVIEAIDILGFGCKNCSEMKNRSAANVVARPET